MTETKRFGLLLPEQDDYFDVEHLNHNMEILDVSIPKSVDIASMQVLTADAYAALGSYDAKTLYLVVQDGAWLPYLGEMPIQQSGGGGTAVSLILTHSTTPTITGREIVTEEV